MGGPDSIQRTWIVTVTPPSFVATPSTLSRPKNLPVGSSWLTSIPTFTEIHLPPGACVPYPAASLAFQRVAVWVLEGHLTFHVGDVAHDLGPGDSIELEEPVEHLYANTTDSDCRCAIVLARVKNP